MAAAPAPSRLTMRPYYPYRRRGYGYGYGAGGAGGGINVGQIGQGVTQLVKAIQAGQAAQQLRESQARQDVIANRLLNTQFAPRAQWVGGTAPRAGVPLAGTAPATGGAAEIQDRIQMAKLAQALQATDPRARAAAALAARGPVGPAAGSRSAWAAQAARGGGWGGRGGGGRQAAAAGGAAARGGRQAAAVDTNAPQNPAQYNFTTMRDQFDAQHGKGAYDKMSPFLDNIAPPGVENTPQTGLQLNAKGGLDYYQNGKLQTSLMGNDADYWLKRINTARSNAGLEPIHTPLQGSGTINDPYLLKSPWDYGSVPYNQYFTTTDSPNVGQKLRPEDAQKVGFAQDIALGGRAGGGEDYLSSWATVGGGATTGPNLPEPLQLAPETGGQGYSASAGAGPPVQSLPDEQAYQARFNPPTVTPSTAPDDQAYAARFNPPVVAPAPAPPLQPISQESVGSAPIPSAATTGSRSYLDTLPTATAIDPTLLMGGT